MTENIKPRMSKRAKIVLIITAISACITIVCFLVNMITGSQVDKKLENASSLTSSSVGAAESQLFETIESSEYQIAKISSTLSVFFTLVTVILLIIGLVLRYRDRRASLP